METAIASLVNRKYLLVTPSYFRRGRRVKAIVRGADKKYLSSNGTIHHGGKYLETLEEAQAYYFEILDTEPDLAEMLEDWLESVCD